MYYRITIYMSINSLVLSVCNFFGALVLRIYLTHLAMNDDDVLDGM